MGDKINIPTFDTSMNVEAYEQEVEAWKLVTGTANTKQAIVLILALKEELRQHIWENLSRDDLNKENGVTTYLKYLKDNYGKDDLLDSLERYRDFRDCRRQDGQTISDFIAEFSSKVNKITKKGITIPDEVLSFELMTKSGITIEERKLVATGVDFTKKAQMLQATKNSLKKFIGTHKAKSSGFDTPIKLVDQVSEATIPPQDVNYNRSYPRGNNRGYRGNRGFRGNPRGNNPSRGRNYYQNQYNNQRQRSEQNPIGKDGNLMKCYRCGSDKHFIRFCSSPVHTFSNLTTSNDWSSLENYEEHNNIMMSNLPEKNSLSIEARGHMVIDTACAQTCSGEDWMNDYITNHLSPEERKEIIETKGWRSFRFGGGPMLISTAELIIPAIFAGEKIKIRVDVVKQDVPLLLSMRALQRARGNISMEKQEITLWGRNAPFTISSTGHILVPMKDAIHVNEVCTNEFTNMDNRELKKKLVKLHAQFGHPAKHKLINLLKNAEMWKDTYSEILESIHEHCQICIRHSKTPARPVVSMPMSDKFNKVVCIDLKDWEGKWILHMIDMYSRFTQSVWVSRKKSQNILDAILQEWCGVFGVMDTILSDNGGEFTSEEFREVASMLNIRKITTAGYSPWQNGLCERVHATTDHILTKLIEEFPDTNLHTLLRWANMARNSLQMSNGFSSHQLVFGNNPNLPNIMNAKPPALEETTGSEIFAKHLNIMQKARQAYITAENSERVKRALRHKIRTNQETFTSGEEVYYKRDGKEKWLGPGKVMFQDGKIVFVRHGSVYG